MHSFLLDLRHSWRSLLKTPGLTAVAVLTLALGIGANAAMLAVVDGVLLKPLAYASPERLVAIFEHPAADPERREPTSPANFLDWQRASRSFEQMTAAHPWSPVLRGEGRPETISALRSSPNLFELLKASPLLGSGFDPAAQGERAVVLSHGLWQRRFAADPDIVGRTFSLDGEPYTVAGVMPAGFAFPPFWHTSAELWAPLDLDSEQIEDRHARFLRTFARLRAGVTTAAAHEEMATLGGRLAAAHPNANGGIGVKVEPLLEPVVGDARRSLLLLLGTVGFVLLIAAANVASLLLARTAARHGEVALRAALGASRWQLARLLLAESALLGLLGGLAGLLLGAWVIDGLQLLAPAEIPRLGEITIDVRVVGFTLVLSLLTGGLFGALPALSAARGVPTSELRTLGRSGGRGARQLLVVAEISLAAVLLVGAGLLIKSFFQLWRLDPGFERRGVLTLDLSLAGSRHAAAEAQTPFFDQLIAEAGSLPGVERAALVNHLPIGGDLWSLGLAAEDRAIGSPAELVKTGARVVSPDYFAALGIPRLAGRGFDAGDRADSTPVAIVSRSLAERLWPGQDPLGRRLANGMPAPDRPVFTVVGVVGDNRQESLREPLRPEMFLPYSQNLFPWYEHTTLVVRTARDPAVVGGEITDRVAALDGEIAISPPREMAEILDRAVLEPSFGGFLFALFAALALVLSVVGIYGVMSHAASQRRREIGLRLAIGASRGQILRGVMSEGLRLAALGLGLGLAGALALTRLLSALLFEVSPLDPASFALAAALLGATAALACWVPARRAAATDPAETLRAE